MTKFILMVCGWCVLLAPVGHGAERYIDEQFNRSLQPTVAPRWACDPFIPVTWELMNTRTDFRSTNTNRVQFLDGNARIYSHDNSATGGYIGLYHILHPEPESWRLRTKIQVLHADAERPVPECLVNTGPLSNSECEAFPNDSAAGKLGWQAHVDQELILRDGDPSAYPIRTGYQLAENGGWHIVEVTSTPRGSEIRAWQEGNQRPKLPLATGMSLGPARRVHFGGPNFKNFEYFVDYVIVEAIGGPDSFAGRRVVLEEHFNTDTEEVIAPQWICDPALPMTWRLGDARADFQSTATDVLRIENGAARLSCQNNSATGGYVALVCPVFGAPAAWRLFARVKVDVVDPQSRPVPSCLVQSTPTPNEPCNMFPNDSGPLGWVMTQGQVLGLRDSTTIYSTGYAVPGDGSWHNIELISTSNGSELRAWPDGARRPVTPMATGNSLGVPKRVHFGGPNFRNFDYSIDDVILESL